MKAVVVPWKPDVHMMSAPQDASVARMKSGCRVRNEHSKRMPTRDVGGARDASAEAASESR